MLYSSKMRSFSTYSYIFHSHKVEEISHSLYTAQDGDDNNDDDDDENWGIRTLLMDEMDVNADTTDAGAVDGFMHMNCQSV